MLNLVSNKEKIELNKKGVLWHGTTVENAMRVFSEGCFQPFTSQRFWENGLRFKEDHPDYEKSKWMYGWCMSRDINVSKTFGEVLFAFEKSTLRQRFKVKPYAWNFSLVKETIHAKQEREEFILSGGILDSLHHHEDEQYRIEKEMDRLNAKLYSGTLDEDEEYALQDKVNGLYDDWERLNFHEKRKQAHGRVLPLEMAVGFYLRKKDFESMGAYREILDGFVQDHSNKFLGFIE